MLIAAEEAVDFRLQARVEKMSIKNGKISTNIRAKVDLKFIENLLYELICIFIFL